MRSESKRGHEDMLHQKNLQNEIEMKEREKKVNEGKREREREKKIKKRKERRRLMKERRRLINLPGYEENVVR